MTPTLLLLPPTRLASIVRPFCSVGLLALCTSLGACSANSADNAFGTGGHGHGGSSGQGGSAGYINLDSGVFDSNPEACAPHCSQDHRAVVGCNETVIEACALDEACAEARCQPACEAAGVLRSSVGCDYYPVMMAGYAGARGGCFAVFVANAWDSPAHVSIGYRGVVLDPAQFGYRPQGAGRTLTYQPYDPSAGIAPGEVGIFFLAGPAPDHTDGAVDCPVDTQAALTNANIQLPNTGVGYAFHLTSDVPVVAYQILPYGGGSAAVTGASLLLPTSSWDTNYIAVSAYRQSGMGTRPSLNLVAMQDGTQITILPNQEIQPGAPVPRTPANTPAVLYLNQGQFVQITQPDELTGSPIQSNFPVALMAGHECLQLPFDKSYCDHAEQQIPPVRALGNEYAAVSYRQRSQAPEPRLWRFVGAVDGTQITFDPPIHEPSTLGKGQVEDLVSEVPFVVRSQDKDHPFLLTTYMSGSSVVTPGYGDPDFVRMMPPGQYLSRYVFFTDPTYPETNLVVIREKGEQGFADVELDCAGTLTGWQALGTEGRFEYTKIDLVSHDFVPQNNCNNGPHEMHSERPFGLWVWGWGSPETQSPTQNVSYGYPAGENVVQLNNVVVTPSPR